MKSKIIFKRMISKFDFQATLGLLRNLAQNQENRVALRDLDLINQLVGICSNLGNTLQQNQNDREAIVSYF